MKKYLSVLFALLPLMPLMAAAQSDWPKASAIKFIVPFTAGSGTDIVARSIAERLGPALGQQIIIENKPGAGGTVGASLVAKAPADGYTFLIHSSGHLVNPSLYPKLPYDTLKDFDGITPLASLPNVLVTSPDKGFKSVQDLIAKAKAKPDAFSYGSAGNGSATHMNAEQFRLTADIKAVHVPFRGTPEVLTETMSGRLDWFFAPLVSAMPHITSGKLQALAVGTANRSPSLPNVPSMTDVGMKPAAYTFWVGLFATAKTPKPIVERMHAEVIKVLASKEIQERFEKLGAVPMPMPQAEFETMLDVETKAATALVKSAGIKVE
jgi:tripartite-type tricarboxylate transporter receptor subunit TctC